MPAEFTHRRALRFAETDMAGVGHFSSLVTLAEEAWHAWLDALGECVHPDAAPPGADPAGWPVVSLHVDFLRPIRFGDSIEIRLAAEPAGTRRIALRFAFITANGEAAAGTLTVACAARDAMGNWRSRDLPDCLATKLGFP